MTVLLFSSKLIWKKALNVEKIEKIALKDDIELKKVLNKSINNTLKKLKSVVEANHHLKRNSEENNGNYVKKLENHARFLRNRNKKEIEKQLVFLFTSHYNETSYCSY